MTKHETYFIVTQRNKRNNETQKPIWRCAKCGIKLDPDSKQEKKGLCDRCLLIENAKPAKCPKCGRRLNPGIFLDDDEPGYIELIYLCDTPGGCGDFWNTREVVYI